MLDYDPRLSTRLLLKDVEAVLAENELYWPLSVRAIYYRLLGTGKYPKGKGLADRVSEHVSNARRAGWIPWKAVYDSGEERSTVPFYDDAAALLLDVRYAAGHLRLNRQIGQPQHMLVWCEAKGMVPMLAGVTNEYGIDVLSTSGYDSTSVRHDIGIFAGQMDVPVHILHVGDLDKHGLQIFHAMSEDVIAWAEHEAATYEPPFGSEHPPGRAEVVRLAVTPEQVTSLQLPDDPEAPGNVQAEAIPPAVLVSLVTDAIESRLDHEADANVLAREAEEQRKAVAAIGNVGRRQR